MTLVVAPALQSALLAAFFLLGRALTPNQFVRSQHILDPAHTLTMSVVAASQLGLLLTGIGSDIDMIWFTGFGLGAVLLVLGVVLFGAERHTYAGLRMPWPIESDRAWTFVHRVAGLAASTAGIALAVLTWSDPGIGPLLAAFAAALIIPPALSALVTVLVRGA